MMYVVGESVVTVTSRQAGEQAKHALAANGESGTGAQGKEGNTGVRPGLQTLTPDVETRS